MWRSASARCCACTDRMWKPGKLANHLLGHPGMREAVSDATGVPDAWRGRLKPDSLTSNAGLTERFRTATA
jgi:hypothetical protein